MGNRRRTKQLIALLVLMTVSSVRAQQYSRDSRAYFDFGDQSYITAKQSATADSLHVYVNTANALFSFLKTDKSLSSRGEYFAVRDLSVELRSASDSKVLSTTNVRDTIFAQQFSQTTSKETWHSAVLSLPIASIAKPMSVTVRTEIRDGFLARPADRPVSKTFTLRAFTPVYSIAARDTTDIGIADPMLFDDYTSGCNECTRNFGATTEFGHDLNGMLPLASATEAIPDSVIFRLYEEDDYFHTPNLERTLVSSVVVHRSEFLLHRKMEIVGVDSVVRYASGATIDTSTARIVVPFVIPGSHLEQSECTLEVKVYRGTDVRTTSVPLQLEWHDMPLSLQSAKDAIAPMSYILSDEAYSAMTSGSITEETKKLFAYWKTQDPTPATAYNERMAEFYRRADYAYFNFAKSSRQLDGAMTDRGKIYILFGPPTNIRRSFLVGEDPTERWTYSNEVKKVFRFIGKGSGEFKLVAVTTP